STARVTTGLLLQGPTPSTKAVARSTAAVTMPSCSLQSTASLTVEAEWTNSESRSGASQTADSSTTTRPGLQITIIRRRSWQAATSSFTTSQTLTIRQEKQSS